LRPAVTRSRPPSSSSKTLGRRRAAGMIGFTAGIVIGAAFVLYYYGPCGMRRGM
jgi:hypothetical protein